MERNFNLRGTGHIAYSPGYNEWLYRRKGRALDRALEPVPRRGRALDVGSGTGWVVRRLIERGHDVVGCDIAETSVSRLRAAWPQACFHRLDLGSDSLPEDDSSFDLITFCDVAYHIVDEARFSAALAELARVIRPGGRLVAIDGLGTADEQPAPHVRFRGVAHWEQASAPLGLLLEELLPCYRWLSRDPATSGFRHLPGTIRGPVEYTLELLVPRAPHMRVARFCRSSS